MEPGRAEPFNFAIQSVFSKMLQLEVIIGPAARIQETDRQRNVLAVINITGDLGGSISFEFDEDSAVRIASLFSGQDLEPEDEGFADAIGELGDMIAGCAMSHLDAPGIHIDRARVSVNARIDTAGTLSERLVSLPCRTDCGMFVANIDLSIATIADSNALLHSGA